MKTLEKVDILSLNVTIWTGRKKLRAEDLKLGEGGKLPSEDVASLGSKKVMDPERLNVFYKLKKQMERTLEAVGIRFLGGYAIPRDKTALVTKDLDRIVQEFTDEKAKFLSEYDNAVEGWISKHEEFADALRRAIEPAQSISNRLMCDYSTYRISPADASGSLDREVQRMGNKLLYEVAQDANELYERTVAKREEKSLNRRIASPLRRIRDKLDGLSFLDGAVAPMVATIDDLIDRFPEKGNIEDGLYHEVVATILILSDPDKIREHAARRSSPHGMGGFFSSDQDDQDQPDLEEDDPDDEEGDGAQASEPVKADSDEEESADTSAPDFSIFSGLFVDTEDQSPVEGDAAATESVSEAVVPSVTGEDVQTDEDPVETTSTIQAEEEPAGDATVEGDAAEASADVVVDEPEADDLGDEERGDVPIVPSNAPVEAVESFYF